MWKPSALRVQLRSESAESGLIIVCRDKAQCQVWVQAIQFHIRFRNGPKGKEDFSATPDKEAPLRIVPGNRYVHIHRHSVQMHACISVWRYVCDSIYLPLS
jgi:hypothetical protein